MAQPAAYIYCPHIVEATKQKCGLNERGGGRVTRIPIPFAYLDGKPFVITCPACEQDVLVDTPQATEDDDEEERVA